MHVAHVLPVHGVTEIATLQKMWNSERQQYYQAQHLEEGETLKTLAMPNSDGKFQKDDRNSPKRPKKSEAVASLRAIQEVLEQSSWSCTRQDLWERTSSIRESNCLQ